MSRKKRTKTQKLDPMQKARREQMQGEWTAVEGAKSDVHTGGVGAPQPTTGELLAGTTKPLQRKRSSCRVRTAVAQAGVTSAHVRELPDDALPIGRRTREPPRGLMCAAPRRDSRRLLAGRLLTPARMTSGGRRPHSDERTAARPKSSRTGPNP